MSKEKKSKINKMEILRQILDNPNNTKINHSDVTDYKNFESIRRRLSGTSSVSTDLPPPSKLISNTSTNLKPKVIIQSAEKKPIETIKQINESTEKPIEKEAIKPEGLYEIEKVETVEMNFLQVIPKDKTLDYHQPSTEVVDFSPASTQNGTEEKNKTEAILSTDEKEGIVDFQEIDNIDKTPSDLSYKTEENLLRKIRDSPDNTNIKEIKEKKSKKLSSDTIQIFRPITIMEMWAFTFILIVVSVSGLFLMRDWLFSNFGVYGNMYINTPGGTQNIHILFGLAFAVLGIFHIIIHIFSKKKDILPRQTVSDFKAFLHSGEYLIGLARREEYGDTGRFTGRQRIIYVALVYILGLTAITGVLQYVNFLSPDLSIVHIIPAGLSIMVLLFHFLITLRKHDFIALKSTFFNGKIPRWYIRKNHPLLYTELAPKKITSLKPRSALSSFDNKMLIERGNALDNAVFKFALLLHEKPDENIIKAISEGLQNTRNSDEIRRIINLAEQLDDEAYKEDNQDTIKEPTPPEITEEKTDETKEQ